MRSPGFLEDLADTLEGICATGCAEGTGAMLKALLRQLDAFAERADGPGEAGPAPKRRRLGEAHEARRRWHALGMERAVRSKDFLSELAEGLAGVSLFASDPVAPKKLVAAAVTLDALSVEVAQEREAELGELREQNRALVAELEEVRGRAGNPGGR